MKDVIVNIVISFNKGVNIIFSDTPEHFRAMLSFFSAKDPNVIIDATIIDIGIAKGTNLIVE